MRKILVLLALAVGCSRGDRGTASNTPTSTVAPSGPDALMLRVPRAGGEAHIVAFPQTDSIVSITRDALPATDHVLGFDADAGLIAAVSTTGVPYWVDLQVGRIITPTKQSLSGLVSADGSTIFGVGKDGAVVRLTPSGNWVFKPKRPVRAVFPQANGMAIALAGRGDGTRLFRLHPPEVQPQDSMSINDVRFGSGAPLGDRVYFATNDRHVIGLRARLFQLSDRIGIDHNAVAVAATPSGDRFFVITDSSRTLKVVDRFKDKITATIDLPGRPREIRMDPVGRFVLVQPVAGDSVWVVATANDKVVGTLKAPWRSDLPLVAPDGSIAVSSDKDISFVDPATGREQRRVVGGASDFWYAFSWNGFRPHVASADTSTRRVATDSSALVSPPVPARDSAPAPVARPDSAAGFTVSFAALLNEAKAKEEAAKISIEGQTARVVTGATDGVPIYRVILGPYPTRDQAERVGRESGQSYYVYAGNP